jgi:hypothetical protein
LKNKAGQSQNLDVIVNLRLFISLFGILLLCLGTAWAQESKDSKDSTEATDGKEGKESKEEKEGEEGKKAEKLPAIFLEGYIPIQLNQFRSWWPPPMVRRAGVRSRCL